MCMALTGASPHEDNYLIMKCSVIARQRAMTRTAVDLCTLKGTCFNTINSVPFEATEAVSFLGGPRSGDADLRQVRNFKLPPLAFTSREMVDGDAPAALLSSGRRRPPTGRC